MSTFTKPSAVVALTLAKDTDINDLADAVEEAFDLIPDETRLERGTTNYVASAGAGNAYTVSMPTTLGAYVDGYEVVMKANHTNTGAATIDIDGLGAKSLRRQYGEALAAGDIRANKIVPFRYNSTSGYFEMQLITTGNMADVATVAGISGNVSTVAGVSADVTTVAGIAADVTVVAGINTDVSAVSAINAAVSAVAAVDAAVAVVATDLAGADTIGTVAADLAGLDTIGAVAAIAANVTTVAGISGNVTTVAGIHANVTTVAGIAANVTTVAGDSADIGTIATDLNGANTIGTVAGISADVTTVAGISADVSTVAGISANVTTVAGDTVNIGIVSANLSGANTIGAVAAIDGDVSTVAGISANVTTVAGIAANVTTVAGISANVTTVAGVVADVTTVAGIDADVTAVAAIATEIQAANYFSRKNHIINGNFDVWQRGTSFTEADSFGADRWAIDCGTSTAVITQQTFTLGQTKVPNNPRYFSRTVVTSGAGAGSYAMRTQRIEFVKTLSGVTATFSFYAKADASKNLSVEFVQHFGTGGSPSADVTAIGVTKIALTTSWTKFTVTVAIPSISGKTLGTDLNDFLGAYFWFDAGSDFDARTDSLGNQSGTFDISQIQFEQGSVATTFEPRTYGEELALCQRYYWQGAASNGGSFRYGEVTAASEYVAEIGSFPVEMRTLPTMVMLTAPTYINCVHGDIAAAAFTGFTHRVRLIALGTYTVSGGVYSASAEL